MIFLAESAARMVIYAMPFQTLWWQGDRLVLLDQTKLPGKECYRQCRRPREVAEAIRRMVVRGAPAIGVAAAFGMALGAKLSSARNASSFLKEMDRIGESLVRTRPTAVNLFWAVERQKRVAEESIGRGLRAAQKALEEEAGLILREDLEGNRAIGRHGQELIRDGDSVLTHCNAGALATAGFGTALGVIRAAVQAGKHLHVYIDETRPLLQGSRLTAWELLKDHIPCTLIADNMAGHLMAQGKIHLAIVGADRIAANGDVANKIGTYSLALLCQAHGIPFYVAAPTSTIDLHTKTGRTIPIEERAHEEMVSISGRRIAPPGIRTLNPAFDVTPQRYIRAIITERGVIRRPYLAGLKKIKKDAIGNRPKPGKMEEERKAYPGGKVLGGGWPSRTEKMEGGQG